MKRLLLSAAALLTLALTISANTGKEYPQTFIVSDIDTEADIIYLETFSGMVYTWESVEDWQVKDIAAATMNDNGTETITDDTIKQLVYTGWID